MKPDKKAIQDTCAVCDGVSDGLWHHSNTDEYFPCCTKCAKGRVRRWIDECYDLVKKFPIETTGSIIKDRVMALTRSIWESRIEDGVCPNGCARLETASGHQECPKCKFNTGD
jgi:hypothetical protein